MPMVLRVIGLLLTWGPVVLKSVQQVEILLSKKPGEEKKAAAVELIKKALTLRGIEFDAKTENLVSGLIDFIVSALNAWGSWKVSK